MTADERNQFDEMAAKLAEITRVLPDVQAAVHAVSAQTGEQTAQFVTVNREVARLAAAVDGPPHIDALRYQTADNARRLDGHDARIIARDGETPPPPPPPNGIAEATWRFFSDLAFKTATYLGLDKHPARAALYIAAGLLTWGAVTIYNDFKGEIKAYIAEQFEQEAEADSVRSARAAADRRRTAGAIESRLDTLTERVESVAPDAP